MKESVFWLFNLSVCIHNSNAIAFVITTVVSIDINIDAIAFVVMQIGGSKSARLGVLFSADLSSLLFVKAFEIIVSMYRFVKFSKEFYALSLSQSRCTFVLIHSCFLKA